MAVPRWRTSAFATAAGLCTLASVEAAEPSAAGLEFFERKVRPLLAEHCYTCHGAEKQKGQLRLDSPGAIRAGGEGGAILVAGEPDKSRLVIAVGYQNPDLKMPPKQRLTARQVADLTEWIKMGAPMLTGEAPVAATRKEFQITAKDRAHWAFQPVKRPPVPEIKGFNSVGSNPIDAFIRAKLAAKNLTANPAATPRELVRRAYYDLTGLPPTPAEVEAFVADKSPTAWEHLVDRLLDSPRYGEKWGRHWLDLVRFAESNSYERDGDKPNAWRFRDYVIRAFNSDKPYDRFIREQLAGDELSNADADALIATGFYRLGIWDDEPADRELARYDGLDDIVSTTSQVFLGLTVDCARCHHHKIDPIPQQDYYRLLAFFQNVNHYRNGGPTDEVALFTTDAEKAAHAARVREVERRRDEVQASITALEKLFRDRLAKGENAPQPNATAPRDLDELQFRYYRDTWDKLPDFTLVKAEESGKVSSGLFDIGLRTRNTAFGFVFEGTLIVPKDGDYTFHLDSDDGSRLSVDGKQVILYDGIHGEGNEQSTTVRLTQGRRAIKLEYFQRQNGLGLTVAWSGPGFTRRALSAASEPVRAVKNKSPKSDFAQLIRTEGPRVLGAEQAKTYQALKKELEQLKPEKIAGEKALVVTERGAVPPPTHLLARGNPALAGEVVEPGFLEVLGSPAPVLPKPAADARTSGRRTVLANWITSPDNQLTARVMVNRIWQHHFGRGLVRSASNFGLQGDRPTHPELLDWLASEFVARGWSVKAMHRLIMNSQVYRMSSRGSPAALQADPQNDLLWRCDPRRLTAEEIRDSVLAINGTLNLKMFGPGVFVDIPREVLAGQSQPGKGWGKSSPEEQARRSIYIKVKRSLRPPILESFDVAETDRSAPVRFSTVQPTQALGMLNSAFLNEQADVFAARLRREAGDDVSKQVRLGLQLVTTRPPTDTEVQRSLGLVAALRAQDNATAEVALKYFCLMALNLNELVFVD
ncbi:MAG: DUF1553 domain-containing protein [Proteobacteria bacterium]|nr:DUF1553 domain-containing protein [Verrucomicrobiota bacterium]NBU09877.1 DUF1553 domain-containing protein [Pseudomonadota bacterium]